MAKYELSEDARDDLGGIFDYISAENEPAALRLIDRFLEIFKTIEMHPGLGRQRNELKEGLRSFPEGSYLVFYRLWAGRILIVRVLHAARDLDEIFS